MKYSVKKVPHLNLLGESSAGLYKHLLVVLIVKERERQSSRAGGMLSGPLSLVNLQWVSFIFILLD